MRTRHALPRTLLALALAAGLALSACGDDDDDDGDGGGRAADAQSGKAAFELSGSKKNAKMTGPASVRAGVTEISFKNSGEEEGGLTIIKIEGDHTAAEAIKAGNAWGDKGAALPDWLKFAGGTGDIDAGGTKLVRQSLTAGKYAAVDTQTNAITEFEVTGDGTGELPSADGTITASEYEFESTGLKPGKVSINLTNAGKEPHFVVGIPIKPGKTIEDVRTFIKTEKGEPPFDDDDPNSFDTGTVEGGQDLQAVDIDLKAGKYALLCFIPDRAGGPPHVAKGMVSEATVEDAPATGGY